MSKKTKRAFINVFILFAFSFVVIFLFVQKDFDEIVQIMKTANILMLFITLAIFLLTYLVDGMIIWISAKKYSSSYNLFEGINVSLIGAFFSAITPSATGGQFAQAYILRKQDIKVEKSANMLVLNFIAYELSIIMYCAVTITISYIFNFNTIHRIELFGFDFNFIILSLIGFAIHIIGITGIILLSYSPWVNRFAFWVVKMLNKMHILKDKDYVIVNGKIEKKINFFRDELKDIKGNFKIFLPMLLLHIIKYTISFSIPFFVALTLNMKLSFVELGSAIILSSFLHLIITYIPIPGASGGSELFYAVIFRNFFKTSANVTSSLLIWRFITFYVGLLIGFIATMSFNHRKKTKLITETLQDTKIPTNISSIDESIIDEVNEEKKVKKDEDV